MGFFGSVFGAVSVRLKATHCSTDLLNIMKQSCSGDKKVFLLEQTNSPSFSIDKNSSWPNIFCQIILGQLSREYYNNGKSLDSEDTLIIIQAVGYALSQGYPNDESVQQFLSSLPFDV